MRLTTGIGIAVIVSLLGTSAFARDAARDLRRMIGYTILEADSVQEIIQNKNGTKVLVLYSGSAFRVDGMLLDPLLMTDVIVFGKRAGAGSNVLFVKLLIDNEAYDATPMR